MGQTEGCKLFLYTKLIGLTVMLNECQSLWWKHVLAGWEGSIWWSWEEERRGGKFLKTYLKLITFITFLTPPLRCTNCQESKDDPVDSDAEEDDEDTDDADDAESKTEAGEDSDESNKEEVHDEL